MQLASNTSMRHDLVKQIAPKVTKGVLGMQVALVVAISAAKPNNAVQNNKSSSTEQDHRHDRLDLVSGRSGFEQVRPAWRRFLPCRNLRFERYDRKGLRAYSPAVFYRDGSQCDCPVLLKNFGKEKSRS